MADLVKCPKCVGVTMDLITATAIGDPNKENGIKVFSIYTCPKCKKSFSMNATGNLILSAPPVLNSK